MTDSVFQIAESLTNKRAEERVHGLDLLTKLLVGNTELSFLEDQGEGLARSLHAALRLSDGAEAARYLATLTRIFMADTTGAYSQVVVDAFPRGYFSSRILASQTGFSVDRRLQYDGPDRDMAVASVYCFAGYILFAGDLTNEDTQKLMDSLACFIEDCTDRTVLAACFVAMAALTSLDQAYVSSLFASDEDDGSDGSGEEDGGSDGPRRHLSAGRKLRRLLETEADTPLLESLGHFVLSVFDADPGFWASYDDVFSEIVGAFGKQSSKEELRSNRRVFRAYLDELRMLVKAGRADSTFGRPKVFEPETITLLRGETLVIASRAQMARYLFVCRALSAYDDLDSMVSGNCSVRAFLGLPPPHTYNTREGGAFVEDVSWKTIQKQKAAARAQKERNRRRH